MVGLPILTKRGIFSREVSRMANLFTNQKETDQAIKAAVDQYEKYRHHSSIKRNRNRKNRAKNKRS